MRSFFGLGQQVGDFSDRLAATLAPLSPLLKKGYAWEWTEVHERAFRAARTELSEVKDLAFYDPRRPTALHVDASLLNGLGFILKQQQQNGTWRMMQAGSRFLSDAERRYAMIELECLAAAWGMLKGRQFLEGLPQFTLITDHKPLVPILNDHSLDKLDNLRMRLRLKMQRFDFRAVWVPGKTNIDADALSRAPVDQPKPEDELAEGPPSNTAQQAVISVIEGSAAAVVDPVLDRIGQAAKVDATMVALRDTILPGCRTQSATSHLT